MCASDQAPTFDASQAEATMRSLMFCAAVVMAFALVIGLALAIFAGGQLADARAAYGAGLSSGLFGAIMIVAVGALRGHLTLLRHQRTIDARLNQIGQLLTDMGATILQSQRDTGQQLADHQRAFDDRVPSIERAVDQRLAQLQRSDDERLTKLEQLLAEIRADQQRQASVISNVLEDQVAAQRRSHGRS